MYYQDAMTRFVEFQMDEHLSEENRVAPWQPNFVQCDDIRKTLNVDNRYDLSLDQLADDYVARELNIDAERVKFVTYEQLINLAVRTNLCNKTFKEKFHETAARENVPENGKHALWRLFEQASEANRLHYAGAVIGPNGEDAGGGEFIWSCSCYHRIFFSR